MRTLCLLWTRSFPLPVEAAWFDDLTNVTQQEHADEQRDIDCRLHFLPRLVVWLRYIIGIVEDAIDFGHEIVLPCGFVERVGESG